MTKVGYLGPAGSYSQAVCKRLYPQENYPDWQFLEYADLSLLLTAVQKAELSLALIPTQNSKNGVLLDKQGQEFLAALVAEQAELIIFAEKFWVLNFLLLGHNYSHIDQIKVIHLNPYAHEQCREYLSQHADWEIQKHNSSADAAKVAKATNDSTHAAIASVDAAREYGLTILDQQLFQPGDEPVMHFLVLRNVGQWVEQMPVSESVISSFAINCPSSSELQQALVQHGLKLSILRQSKNIPNCYYVDIQGQFSAQQLAEILPSVDSVKWLGTFPACPNRAEHQDKFFS